MSPPPPHRPGSNAVVAEIAPGPRDIVVRRLTASQAVSTGPASCRRLLGCDPLPVAGGTTSGCVRATVSGAVSVNSRAAVAAEGGLDRREASQAMSLFDMHARYGDGVTLGEAPEFVGRQRADGLDPPDGAR